MSLRASGATKLFSKRAKDGERGREKEKEKEREKEREKKRDYYNFS